MPNDIPSIPQVGGTLAHYQLLEKLGEGAMGAVYKGYEPDLRRYVAIKALAPRLSADPEFAERFFREAQAVAALSHPNIVHIFYVGQEGATLFYAMEFVEGQTLESLLQQHKRIDEATALGWILQATEGLRHAAQAGIIHRDIKPANLMLTHEGVIKITDFGLAKAVGDASAISKTSAQRIMGTPHYISPEQASGEAVDERSDIYSLGATLFHLLTGRPPFEGDNAMAIMLKHAKEPPPPLQTLAPQVSAATAAIVAQMLAKKAGDRFTNHTALMRELAHAQQAIAASAGPAPAAPTILAAPARRLRSLRPIALGAAAAVTLLALGWFALTWLRKPGPTAPPPAAGDAPAEEEAQARRQFQHLKRDADALLQAEQFGDALKLYDAYAAATTTEALRSAAAEQKKAAEAAAATAWDRARAQAERLRAEKQYAEAEAVCVRVESVFGLAHYAERARALRAQIQQEREAEQQLAAAEAQREQEAAFLRAARPIYSLVLLLQLDEARAEITKVAEATPAYRERLAPLLLELDRLGAMRAAVAARLQAQAGGPITIFTRSARVEGTLVRADSKGLVVRRRVSESRITEQTIEWGDLSSASTQEILAAHLRADNAEEMLALGIFLTHHAAAQQATTAEARRRLQAAAVRDPAKRALVDSYLARLTSLERIEQEWATAQREAQQAAPAVLAGKRFVPLDISAACNADVIHTEYRLAADSFDTEQRYNWVTTAYLRKNNVRAGVGLPDDGRLAVPNAAAGSIFQLLLPPRKNVIVLTEPLGRQPYPVRLELPAHQQIRYAQLSFLHAASYGDGLVQVKLHYDGGADGLLKLHVLDWYPPSRGRALPPDAVTALRSRSSARFLIAAEMLAQTFAVDPQRRLTAMTFSLGARSGSRGTHEHLNAPLFAAGIFAVSAAAAD